LYLHDVDLSKEDYFIGFFLVGAYQDILGMKHNLFSSPSQLNVVFENDKMNIENFIESQSIIEIFEDLDYDKGEILNNLMDKIDDKKLQNILEKYINDNSYLKTVMVES